MADIGPSPPRRPLVSAAAWGDHDIALNALASADEVLAAAAKRRLVCRQLVARTVGPFVLSLTALAHAAWRGLPLVLQAAAEPNYMQWKVFLGFSHYCLWTVSVKTALDICWIEVLEQAPAVSDRLRGRSAVFMAAVCSLCYVPGMWCLALFLVWEGVAEDDRPTATSVARSAALAHTVALALAVVVLAASCRERRAARHVGRWLRDGLEHLRASVHGCDALVATMRQVPFGAPELKDPGDGCLKECPICTSEFAAADRSIVSTGCRHLFHEDCLIAWCKTHHRCPMCRSDLRLPENLHSDV